MPLLTALVERPKAQIGVLGARALISYVSLYIKALMRAIAGALIMGTAC